MPPFQQEVLQPGRVLLRHIAPQAATPTSAGVVSPPGAGYVVLGQTLFAKPLPTSHLPHSRDFDSGEFTLRVLDAGDWKLSFPNTDAADGQPWRSRFDASGRNEWIEISREGEVEFVGSIVSISPDRQSVTVAGFDGFECLKHAYEQDFSTVMGPRDLIERYTQLPVGTIGDNFPAGQALNAQWAVTTTGANSSVTIGPQGGAQLVALDNPGTTSPTAVIVANPRTQASKVWRATASVWWGVPPSGGQNLMRITEGSGTYTLSLTGLGANWVLQRGTGAGAPQASIPGPGQIGVNTELTLECDGRWVRAFVGGQLVGYLPRTTNTATSPSLRFESDGVAGSSGGCQQTVYFAAVRVASQFLMRGADQGDFVLPGTANTYPTGGLHARFYNDLDLQSDTNRVIKLLNPARVSYSDQLAATVNNPSAPTPGAASTNWSVRFFGAVYLKLSQGNYTFTVSHLDDGCRLWVGNTNYAQPLIDDWNTGGARTDSATASTLGSKDGWYPIILEYFQDTGANGCVLSFTPPVSYTDPGGTALVGGNSVVIPSTSLSPLGCVDQRIQGQSHFDLVQQTAKAFGYQVALEHQSLESGLFPGVLAPRVREGTDYDEVVEPDDIDRRSGMNNYSVTNDAADQASSLRAFGSGIADGKGSQVAFEAVDVPTMTGSLFDMQGWIDAGDIAFPSLLAARANAELGLRLSPWQNVTGEPIARNRIADTFPLTGALAKFQWRPGDGVRLQLSDIGVYDTAPRQIMQITRQFTPEGRTGCKIGFRARPKGAEVALRDAHWKVARLGRSFQKQYVTVQSGYISGTVGAAADSSPAYCAIHPSDQVVKAVVRVTGNLSNVSFNVKVNGTDQTTGLNGPWTGPPNTGVPLDIDIFSYAVLPTNDNAHLSVNLHNNSGATSSIMDFQVFVTVLRAQ